MFCRGVFVVVLFVFIVVVVVSYQSFVALNLIVVVRRRLYCRSNITNNQKSIFPEYISLYIFISRFVVFISFAILSNNIAFKFTINCQPSTMMYHPLTNSTSAAQSTGSNHDSSQIIHNYSIKG